MKIRFNSILGLFIIIIIQLLYNSCKKDKEHLFSELGQFFDSRDDQTYQSVTIGDQTWMAENLNYKTDSGSWIYNNDLSMAEVYGRLYNWETACNACPEGWHLPSDSEWSTLIDYLGGESTAGGMLKEEGTSHWNPPNYRGSNSVDFSALPGGSYYEYDEFFFLGDFSHYWSSTEYDSDEAWIRVLFYHQEDIWRRREFKEFGLSVRCIKDKLIN